MNPQNVPHRIAQRCGVCLPFFLILGLLVPGCAGKRSDMLSALIKPKQGDTETSAADGKSATDDGSSSLIAGADSNLDNSQLSAFTAEEIIEGRPKLRTRVRSWFTRDNAALSAGDPFLDDEDPSAQEQTRDGAEDRKAIAGSEDISGGESLASFRTTETGEDKEPSGAIKPWWQTADSAQERKTTAGSENARVDELLASFQTRQTPRTEPTDEVQPWWEAGSTDSSAVSAKIAGNAGSPTAAGGPKTTFSRQFDSRLERLRAELHLDDKSAGEADIDDASEGLTAGRFSEQEGRPQPEAPPKGAASPTIAARSVPEQANPFAIDSEQSQDLPIVAGKGALPAEQPYPSLMTQPRQPVAGPEAAADLIASADRNDPFDARTRVQSLMDDAQQDWKASRLQRAHQTAVAAQALAASEDVQFLDGEERPADLARRIAADLEKDMLAAVADEPAQALPSNPFQETDELGIRSASAASGFDELERLANPWTVKDPARAKFNALTDPPRAQTETRQQAESAEPVVASQNSGVSLLPPDDDFPSDAEERDWAGADPRDIRLATHKFPEFSLPGDQQIRDQMKGLSAADNQALLRNVADQKNRVLSSKGIQWPELPAAHQPADLGGHSDGPIHVAQAPRFTLADDMAVAAAPDSKADGETPPSGGLLLSQFWRSQPIWFIGGVLLLIVALRLWPWPKKEEF